MAIRFNMDAFEKAAKAAAKRREELLLMRAQKLTLDVGAKAARATPVDTGEARGGWEIETPQKLSDVGKVTNSVPHIVALESGHSPQAPQGIIAQAVDGAINFGGDE